MPQTFAERIFWHHHKSAQIQLRENEDSLHTTLRRFCRFFRTDENKSTTESDKPFLRFYLKTTSAVCTQFLSVNIVLLLVTVYVIMQRHFGAFHITLDPSFDHFYPAVVEIAIWMLMSTMCLVYFVVLAYRPQTFVDFIAADACEVWYEIGAAILLSRFLLLITYIYWILAEGSCAEMASMSSMDSTFAYIFLKMASDAYQAFAFATLPFPQPWTVFFTLIELIKQEIRLLNCSGRITQDPANMWIIKLVAILLAITYITLLMVPSIYVENSVRNLYHSNEQRLAAEKQKRELVGFLSTDVRVPLQYLLHSMQQIDFAETTGKNAESVVTDINHYTRVINGVADDLLLLVRIKENRYTTKRTHLADLNAALNTTVQGILQRRSADTTRGRTDNCTIDVNAPSRLALLIDERCLLTALRHLLIFLTSRSRDAESERSRFFSRTQINAANALLLTRLSLSASVEEIYPTYVVTTVTDTTGTHSVVRAHSQVLKVTVSGEDQRQHGWTEQRRVQEATTAYVCNSIAVSCGGTFAVQRGSYVLSLPCEVGRSEASTESEAQQLLTESLTEQVVDFAEADLSAERSAEVDDLSAAPPTSHQDDTSGAFLTNENSAAPLLDVSSSNISASDSRRARMDAAAALLESERRALSLKLASSADTQAYFTKNRVCVIVEDTVLVSVITGAVHRLRLDVGMAVLHELQAGSIPIAKLTFVTSYQLCLDLRERKYAGLIVLFSGSSSYLDDAQMAKLDYCLPLPSSDLHLSLFLDWLIDTYESSEAAKAIAARDQDQSKSVAAPHQTLKDTNKSTRRGVSWHPELQKKAESFQAVPSMSAPEVPSRFIPLPVVAAFSSAWRFLPVASSGWTLVSKLPEGSKESFTKWKWLNPSGSWHNWSTEQWLTAPPRLVFSVVVEALWFRLRPDGVIPPILVVTLHLLKAPVYKYLLKPCGIPLHKYLYLPDGLVEIMLVYINVKSFMILASAPDYGKLSLTDFLATEFGTGGLDGRQSLFFTLTLATYCRLQSIYQSYPLNQFCLFLLLIRLSQNVWMVFPTIISVQMCQFVQLVFVQLTVLNLIYLTYLENTYRREFTTAYQHILDKAFLDQCLDICQQDIRKPLAFLQVRQDDLMELLTKAAFLRTLKVDAAFAAKLEPLHVSRVLLDEMVNELLCGRRISQRGSQRGLPVSDQRSMQAVELARSIAALVSAFASRAADHHVRIYAEVDNRLAVVMVDWKVLSMVLTNLLSAALKNIQDYCIETPRNKDLTNHILLKFVAVENPHIVPFSQQRLMLINVCDTSNAAAKAYARSTSSISAPEAVGSNSMKADGDPSDRTVSQYGRSVCEQLVLKASTIQGKPIFQTIAVQSSFQTAQRFTFPYHLTQQTRKAQEFIESETDRDFVTVCMSTPVFFAAYQRVIYPDELLKPINSVMMPKPAGAKEVLYLSGMTTTSRSETIKLIKRFEGFSWYCNVKYVLSIPSLHTIGGADCVLIDQQLEVLENISISDTVLKLRVCGFNGLIAVLLQDGVRNTDVIKNELSRSAADIDMLIMGPLKDTHIQALGLALANKYIRQVLYMNGN